MYVCKWPTLYLGGGLRSASASIVLLSFLSLLILEKCCYIGLLEKYIVCVIALHLSE